MDLRYHLRGLWRWSRLVRRHGRPAHLFFFDGGIGDQLLCSALAYEMQRRQRVNLWLMTRVPELFTRNDDLVAIPGIDLALVPWARWSGARVMQLYYQPLLATEGRDAPLAEPAIASLCRRAGVEGTVSLRPYLPAVPFSPRLASRSRPRVAIQSTCLTARYPIANKQWPVDRLQAVVTTLKSEVEFVQFGGKDDPLLAGAQDQRGLALLEVARELSQCDALVGLVGFLMHLARAVECPSVVIYGGREPPELTGYSCNVNLANRPECSPCWNYSRCDYDRRCLAAIQTSDVIQALRELLANPPARPLPVESFVIEPAGVVLNPA